MDENTHCGNCKIIEVLTPGVERKSCLFLALERDTLNRALGPICGKKKGPRWVRTLTWGIIPWRTPSWSFEAKLLSPHLTHFTVLVCGEIKKTNKMTYFLTKIHHFCYFWSILPKNVSIPYTNTVIHPKQVTFDHTDTLDLEALVSLVIRCTTEAFPQVINVHHWTAVCSSLFDYFFICTEHSNIVSTDLLGPNFSCQSP